MEKELIAWSDFEKIDIQVGTVIYSEINENTFKPSFIIHVDFGPLGIKKTSAQITSLYVSQRIDRETSCWHIKFPEKTNCQYESEFLFGVH